jgi:hypothetical protein
MLALAAYCFVVKDVSVKFAIHHCLWFVIMSLLTQFYARAASRYAHFFHHIGSTLVVWLWFSFWFAFLLSLIGGKLPSSCACIIVQAWLLQAICSFAGERQRIQGWLLWKVKIAADAVFTAAFLGSFVFFLLLLQPSSPQLLEWLPTAITAGHQVLPIYAIGACVAVAIIIHHHYISIPRQHLLSVAVACVASGVYFLVQLEHLKAGKFSDNFDKYTYIVTKCVALSSFFLFCSACKFPSLIAACLVLLGLFLFDSDQSKVHSPTLLHFVDSPAQIHAMATE